MATETPKQSDCTVIVAVDGNEPSLNAFKYYLKYIHRDSNNVILAHAMQTPSMPSREEWEKTHKEARRASQPIEKLYGDLMEEHNVNGRFEAGMEKAGEFIVDLAHRSHARLIVMGTRGLSTMKRAFLGSVSDHVVHHARCPVLVFRH